MGKGTRENRTRKSVSFSLDNEEKDLLEFALKESNGNFSVYIKTLLHKEMEKKKQRSKTYYFKDQGSIVLKL